MKLDTKKVLKKILILKTNLERKKEFEAIHEDMLNLCRIIYSKKAHYQNIDVQYPKKLTILIADFSGKTKGQKIDGNPNRKDELKKLKEGILVVLNNLKRYFELKKELESNEDLNLTKDLNEIKKQIKKLRLILEGKYSPANSG